MTVIVGVQCLDGVVMGSDSAASFAAGAMPTIGQQIVTKVHDIDGRALLSACGAVGIAQMIVPAVQRIYGARELSGSRVSGVDQYMSRIGVEIGSVVRPHFETAKSAVGVVGNHELQGPLVCRCLIGAFVEGRPYVLQFAHTGAPEHSTPQLPFVALGSGQMAADPFLAFLRRVICPGRVPTLAEGRLMVTWTLKHVIECSPGGVGGPIQLGWITMEGGATTVSLAADVAHEHLAAVHDAERTLRAHVTGAEAETEAGPIPTPPTE